MRLLLIFMLIQLCAFCPSAFGQSIDKIQFPFDGQALDGSVYALSVNDKQLKRVFVFLSTTCPIANSYISELNRLQRALPPGVELYGVVSEPHTSRQNASKHFAEFKVEFPILFDASQLLMSLLKTDSCTRVVCFKRCWRCGL